MQGGLCAICRVVPAAHVDHDHRTNRVRALCFNGNGALGQFRDRSDLMLRAMAYLDRHPAELPDYQVSIFIGDLEGPRPAGEQVPWLGASV